MIRAVVWSIAGAAVLAWGLARGQEEEPAQGGIVTLWAHDDLACALSFSDGGAGARIEEGRVVLDDAQLVYHALAESLLSLGFVRDELARIVDLGAFFVPGRVRGSDLAPSFAISVFHTLGLDKGHFVYRDADGSSVRLREADPLLSPLQDTGPTHVEPLVDHTYLLRFRPRSNRRFDSVVKLEVLAVRPGESVTLRWAFVAEL